jgi:hypothetical protein
MERAVPQLPVWRRSGATALTVACLAVGALAGPAAAQSPQGPPISGATGTIALEGSVDSIYQAAGTITVVTADGVTRIFRAARNLVVHGGGPTPQNDWLSGLKKGSAVVVHYSGTGDDATAHEIDQVGGAGLKISEGVVTGINRERQEITVRFDAKRTETLKLTDRAARDVGTDVAAGSGQVRVYYTDTDGQKVAHYFKKK